MVVVLAHQEGNDETPALVSFRFLQIKHIVAAAFRSLPRIFKKSSDGAKVKGVTVTHYFTFKFVVIPSIPLLFVFCTSRPVDAP